MFRTVTFKMQPNEIRPLAKLHDTYWLEYQVLIQRGDVYTVWYNVPPNQQIEIYIVDQGQTGPIHWSTEKQSFVLQCFNEPLQILYKYKNSVGSFDYIWLDVQINYPGVTIC